MFGAAKARPKGSEKRRRNRAETFQKAVLCSHANLVFRILDISSTGAKIMGPHLKEIFGAKADSPHPLEFLIHYGGAQYKRVRALVKWSQLGSKTFGIEFVD